PSLRASPRITVQEPFLPKRGARHGTSGQPRGTLPDVGARHPSGGNGARRGAASRLARGGRLRRDLPWPRNAPPRPWLDLSIEVEDGRTQFDDLEHGLDGVRDVAGRPPRRAFVTRRTLGAAKQAQPVARRREAAGNVDGEPCTIFGRVEHVKDAAVEHDVKWTFGRRREEVVDGKADRPGDRRPCRPRVGSLDGARRNVHAEDIPSLP